MQKFPTPVKPELAEMMNDASIDRMMAIDNNWRIIAWNKTSALVSGISKEEIIGKHLLAVFPELQQDEDIIKAIRHAMEGRKSFVPANEQRINRQHYENHFMPLTTEEGEVIGVMTIAHDVSHRIKAERQLQRLNEELEKKYMQLGKASGDLSTLTYITSNNLKQPVRFLYTNLEDLMRTDGQSLSNNGKAKLRKMQSSLNRISLLLDDILSLSQVSSFIPDPELIDTNELLQQVIQEEKLNRKISEKKAEITWAPLPPVYGNKKMTTFVFSHLLQNAIKFAAKKTVPKIRIEGKVVQAKSDNETSSKTYIRFSITDNGIGIHEQDLQRIFDLFERVHPEIYAGSGVGLTICKKIMEAHDGLIDIKSTPGEGSTFCCYFPLHTDN